MKNLKSFTLILLLISSISAFAQNTKFVDTSGIRYNYYAHSAGYYGVSFQFNHLLQKDGDHLIYEYNNLNDSVLVGRFHFKDGFLIDSGFIKTSDYLLSAFFIKDSSPSQRNYIPEIDEYGVLQGVYKIEKRSQYGLVYAREEVYDHGLRNGNGREFTNFYTYSEKGGERHTYAMNNDTLQGYYCSLYENGDTIEAGFYDHGLKEGYWFSREKTWEDNRILTSYHNGLKNGEEYRWSSGGHLISREFFLNDKHEGTSTWWNEKGQMTGKTYWKQGMHQLTDTGWHDNGRIRYLFPYDSIGKTHGRIECFYDNGVKESVTEVRHGVANGVHEDYYRNGKLARLYYYKNEKLEGVYKEWNAKGVLTAHLIYKKGEVQKTFLDKRVPEEDMVAEVPGPLTFGSAKIPYFQFNYPSNERVMDGMVWLKEQTLMWTDSLNMYYAGLKKKERKKWTLVDTIEITTVVQNSKITTFIKDVGSEEKNRILISWTTKIMLANKRYPSNFSVKITIPCHPVSKK